MSIKKFLLIIFLSLFGFLQLAAKPVSAHVLKTSGTIGAVIHVTPEDDPIAGEKSDFFFEFKDTTNTFSPLTCDCILSIQQGGKEIFSKPLFSDNTNPSLNHASASFTFPERDIYAIVIKGKPIRQGTFSPFTLEYAIRVDRLKAVAQKTDNRPTNTTMLWVKTHAVHALPAVVAVLFLGFIVIHKRKNHK